MNNSGLENAYRGFRASVASGGMYSLSVHEVGQKSDTSRGAGCLCANCGANTLQNRFVDPFEADIDGCSRKRTRRSQSGAQPQAATAAMHAAINSAMPRGSQGAAQSQAAERLPVEDLMQELQDLQEGDLGGSLGLGSMDMEELFSSMTTEQQSMVRPFFVLYCSSTQYWSM